MALGASASSGGAWFNRAEARGEVWVLNCDVTVGVGDNEVVDPMASCAPLLGARARWGVDGIVQCSNVCTRYRDGSTRIDRFQ